MRNKPDHSCFQPCAGCAYELGNQDAKKKPKENAKYVWAVINSDNPCDIRRYSFSHEEGMAQLAHVKNNFKDQLTGGEWVLYKLLRVKRKQNKPQHPKD